MPSNIIQPTPKLSIIIATDDLTSPVNANKPQNDEPFMDLDTSGIDGDPGNQDFGNNFEPEGDNSFVENMPENNVFQAKMSFGGNVMPENIPDTPHLGMENVGFLGGNFLYLGC